jgi:predicted nucleic acid-binding protein
MSFLLDTNVLSEVTKPTPAPQVIAWLNQNSDAIAISVVTLAEIRSGIEQMPVGKRRSALSVWLHMDVATQFAGRTIPLTEEIAQQWGVFAAQSIKSGPSMTAFDCFLAATSFVQRLTLVTRNRKHFDHLDIRTLNPWN